MKTIVTKTNGSWQLEQIEDGKIFDDNMKAVRFFEKKIEDKKENGKLVEGEDFLTYLKNAN
tara:strand:- start:39 stop:221 length:183 start_codon:yes stop_codon:yes gene_type:complete